MYEKKLKVKEVIQRTQSAKSFRFEIDEEITFKPGQYLLVTLEVDGEKITKPLSLSNSPTEKGYIEFTKRITESGFSKKLNSMKPGDEAFLKLPYGKLTFEGEYEKIALLSGGIGITPFRSICKFASDKALKADIFLFYGNNTISDIIFHDDLDNMQRDNPNFHVLYALTKEGACPNACYRAGYIDECMIKEKLPDFLERVFYVCGPPGMAKCMVEMLKDKLKVPGKNIKLEQFMGY